MSSSRSWLQSLSPGRVRRDSNHELPLWRAPSPMTASMIPPPIVQSTIMPPPEDMKESRVAEKSAPFEERQHELEADLQILLDAQAEGLIRGLEGGSQSSRNSTGSTTPTFKSTRGDPTKHFRKPATRLPGLRSARKGIYSSIIALSSLKDEELEELDTQIQTSEHTIDQIEAWEKKREGLQEASQSVDSSEDTNRVQQLKQEARAVEADIVKVELHLMELRTKQRKLLRQAAAVENSVQAKLASYTSSLRMLEEDVGKFLSLSPPSEDNGHVLQQVKPTDTKSSVWALPPQRRNLEMAKDFWTSRRHQVLHERKVMEDEKAALVDGAELWKTAVVEVTDFEKSLRAEVSTLSMSSSQQSTFAWDDSHFSQQNAITDKATSADDRMRDLLNKMTTVIASLEGKYSHAEEQNWRLLIAAIGAELDALRRGQRLLEDVAGVSVDHHQAEHESNGLQHDDDGQEIHDLDKSFETARRRHSLTRQASDLSDDGPDPELMFSRQGLDYD